MNSVLLKGFISFAITLGICNAFLFILILPPVGGHYKLPSSSMAPTLNAGDHIYVSKFAYTLSRKKIPSRGDIVLFKNGKRKLVYIKRVIGLPGDKVQMRKGRLYLNGKIIERQLEGDFKVRLGLRQKVTGVKIYEERLESNIPFYSTFDQTIEGMLDNTSVYNVPAGHIFVMGDNRDNSTDSRVSQSRGGVGYVPIENIRGKVKRVIFQSKSCREDGEFYCPSKQFFKKL